MCGIECVHCKRFRRFQQADNQPSGKDPLNHHALVNDIASFREHLHSCQGVPEDLQQYLSWIDENPPHSRRIEKVAKLVWNRLQRRSQEGNALLAKAIRRAAVKKRKMPCSVLENIESLDCDSTTA